MSQAKAVPSGVDRPEAISVQGLTMGFGGFVVQRDLAFRVRTGDVFVIMGPSGCGKSTLMRHMVGLLRPRAGRINYGDRSLWGSRRHLRQDLMQRLGVMYQGGALWSAMTLAENVELPVSRHRSLPKRQLRDLASYKLALVGLAGYENFYPSQISGGMRKRAAVARAMAMDPEILFFDEPSAGLDPVSARRLDELILELRATLGTTMVVITHDLASIFRIADEALYLDTEARTMLAVGDPRALLHHCSHAQVRDFLRGGDGHE
jgi:phospholipid/cholesterol/gamma-HCH transport system ATP-binding protein